MKNHRHDDFRAIKSVSPHAFFTMCAQLARDGDSNAVLEALPTLMDDPAIAGGSGLLRAWQVHYVGEQGPRWASLADILAAALATSSEQPAWNQVQHQIFEGVIGIVQKREDVLQAFLRASVPRVHDVRILQPLNYLDQAMVDIAFTEAASSANIDVLEALFQNLSDEALQMSIAAITPGRLNLGSLLPPKSIFHLVETNGNGVDRLFGMVASRPGVETQHLQVQLLSSRLRGWREAGEPWSKLEICRVFGSASLDQVGATVAQCLSSEGSLGVSGTVPRGGNGTVMQCLFKEVLRSHCDAVLAFLRPMIPHPLDPSKIARDEPFEHVMGWPPARWDGYDRTVCILRDSGHALSADGAEPDCRWMPAVVALAKCDTHASHARMLATLLDAGADADAVSAVFKKPIQYRRLTMQKQEWRAVIASHRARAAAVGALATCLNAVDP